MCEISSPVKLEQPKKQEIDFQKVQNLSDQRDYLWDPVPESENARMIIPFENPQDEFFLQENLQEEVDFQVDREEEKNYPNWKNAERYYNQQYEEEMPQQQDNELEYVKNYERNGQNEIQYNQVQNKDIIRDP